MNKNEDTVREPKKNFEQWTLQIRRIRKIIKKY